jgi:hypothetical protein
LHTSAGFWTLLGLSAFAVTSTQAAPVVKVALVDQAPRIDGDASDPVWRRAVPIVNFLQREPNLGQPVSEKTEVYICSDRQRLFVAFRCYESDPAQITAKEMARDVSLGEDDRVQVILDTFLDGRNGYWFQVGPRGSIGDALVGDNGAVFNKEWDGLWEGKARIHSQGWDAEMAIPFKTMTFRPGQERWGLKLIRHIRRKLEISYWPAANLDTYMFQVSDSGILEGLEGITQGVGLDLSSYGLGGLNQKVGAETKLTGDAGVDVFYQLTPGLKSALTLNTDFAQTEVDARQVNLTRFPLFFPEKRDFFLEGATYFTFGPSGNSLIPFFSRRVGLDANGHPIPILWGGKLAGQVGAWNLGVLNIMDDRADRNPNFLAARVRRNLGKQSSIGLISTYGNSLSEADNYLTGLDFKLASSTFRGNQNIALSVFGLKSSTEGLRGANAAFGVEFNYPNDLHKVRAGFHQIERNFRAGLGFVPRYDIRQTYAEYLFGPRPGRWGILQVQFGGAIDYITDLHNRVLTRNAKVVPVHLRFASGDQLAWQTSPQYEYLDKTFQIHPRHRIAAGGYEFVRHRINFQSAQRRNLWAGLACEWGGFYDGGRRDVTLALGYKVRVPLYLGLELARNRVSLPEGRFDTNVSRLNANILFSPNATLYNYLQYDNLSQTMGWQSRFRWILKPGNEVLVVWNSRLYNPLERVELTESTARVKLKYNYRF